MSEEGTTQGDNAAMGYYSCALMPLITNLSINPSEQLKAPKQVWYADDSAAGGKLTEILYWWEQLQRYGPLFGYHPKPSKTWLIVKEDCVERARIKFPGINITSVGHKYLGSYIGTEVGQMEFLRDKIEEWKDDIVSLTDIATREPQLAYSAFVYGTSKRWTFVARTTPKIAECLKPLDLLINETFMPAVIGKDHITDTMKEVFTLPTKLGASE